MHSSEEEYTIPSHHVPILTTVTLLALVVEEFIALLLGGALDSLGAAFLFYALFLVGALRIFALLVIWVILK